MFDKPETYEELIRKKMCIDLTKYYEALEFSDIKNHEQVINKLNT